MNNPNEIILDILGQKYALTIHAQKRLIERYGEDADIAEIIKTSIPFGAQRGAENSLLLSKDNKIVLVTVRDGRFIVIKTILTIQQAISNMEQTNLISEKALNQLHELAKATVEPVEDPPLEDPPLENYTLKNLAIQHFKKGYSRKERNKILRSLGYDTAGEDGEIYRKYLRQIELETYRKTYEALKAKQDEL